MAEDFQIQRSRATEPMFYHAPSPPNMTPKNYQHAGVEYALERDHCLIGDAPGLGKSAEAILLGNAIGATRSLIVCPAALRLNWEREVWMWSTLPNVSTYPVLKGSDGISNKHDYVIISYSLLSNPSILHAIMDLRWDHLILDEAHAIKDPKGNKRTKVLCAPDLLPSVVGRITMLTGTPMPNQPVEIYNAARLINWDCIDRMSLTAFREEYYDIGSGMVRGPVFDEEKQCMVNKLHWSNEVRNIPTNLPQLQRKLRKHIMVRRLKEDVLKELPPVRWHMFPLMMTTAIRKALRHPGWKQAEKMYDMDAHAFDAGVPIDGAVATARRELGEAKAAAVATYINELIEEGVEKVVVAAWHLSVLSYLRETLAHHGLVYMDGSTSARNKQAAVDTFQNDDKIKIILGQMIPMGTGWTLTQAQDVVFADFDWTPASNTQMLDRVNRIGQKGNYTVGHVPVVPDSLDERILSAVIKKAQNIHRALDE